MDISATAFKATCLRLLDQVAERGEPITVTKHGRAVAQVVPIDAPAPLLGSVSFALSDEELINARTGIWGVENS